MSELEILAIAAQFLMEVEMRESLLLDGVDCDDDEYKFYKSFTRLSPQNFLFLMTYFLREAPIRGNRERTFSFIEAFFITVARIVSPARLYELSLCLAPMFGRTDESLLSSVISNFHARFTKGKRERLLHIFLHFLERRMDDYIDAFHRKGSVFVATNSIGAVVGLVDGTLLRICRPSMDGQYGTTQRYFYSGYKHDHAVHFMGYLFPDGLFFLLDVNEGAMNDSGAVNRSEVPRLLMEIQRRLWNKKFIFYADVGVLPSDPAFKEFYRIPLYATAHPDDGRRRRLNRTMSSIRVANEWAFGWMYEFFRSFRDKTRCMIGRNLIADYVFANLYLNFKTCLEGRNATSDYFDLKPPDITDFMSVLLYDNV